MKKIIFSTIGIIAFTLLISGTVFAQGMMGFGYGYSWSGVIFMIIFWALVILVVVVFVSWLVRQANGLPHDNGNKAIDILKERYAKGEIDKKEFEEKKKDIV